MLQNLIHSFINSVNYQDPYFPHDYEFAARLLPGLAPPPPTLKPEHLGYGSPGSYRPQIGFTSPNPRGYSTPEPARRIIRCFKQNLFHLRVASVMVTALASVHAIFELIKLIASLK